MPPDMTDRLADIAARHNAQTDEIKRLAALSEDERRVILKTLTGQEFLDLMSDVEFLAAGLVMLNAQSGLVKAIWHRAKDVVDRPDSDNLGRLAQALAHPESVTDAPEAPKDAAA